jgi:hypothetical protein
LPNLDFASERGHGSVFADMQPRGDIFRKLFLVEAMCGSGFLPGQRIFCHCENRNSRAEKLEEISARQFEMMHRARAEFVALGFRHELD